MVDKADQNLEVTQETRAKSKEVCPSESCRQTNPIVRKLLDFSSSDKTRKFSVRNLFQR